MPITFDKRSEHSELDIESHLVYLKVVKMAAINIRIKLIDTFSNDLLVLVIWSLNFILLMGIHPEKNRSLLLIFSGDLLD